MNLPQRFGTGYRTTAAPPKGDPPIKTETGLQHDPRHRCGDVFEKRAVDLPALLLEHSGDHRYAPAPQVIGAAAGNRRIRVEQADHHFGDTRVRHGMRAGRGPAIMVARFKRHIQSRTPRRRTGGAQRMNFRVGGSGPPMIPTRDDPAVSDDDRTDTRIRRGATESFAGCGQGASHKMALWVFDAHIIIPVISVSRTHSRNSRSRVSSRFFNSSMNSLTSLNWR